MPIAALNTIVIEPGRNIRLFNRSDQSTRVRPSIVSTRSVMVIVPHCIQRIKPLLVSGLFLLKYLWRK